MWTPRIDIHTGKELDESAAIRQVKGCKSHPSGLIENYACGDRKALVFTCLLDAEWVENGWNGPFSEIAGMIGRG